MAVKSPLLPPKAGYVEVVDATGKHVYQPTSDTLQKQSQEQRIDEINDAMGVLFDTTSENETQSAAELRRAMQLFAASIEDEATMMEIPSIYPEYQIGKAYQIKDIFRYGFNSVGDPQLYQVLQAHTSSAEYAPDSAVSLYKKIGISEDGTPIWVQPLGATDAYNTGDRVIFTDGKKYESLIDANVWAPDVYPAGWALVEDATVVEPDPDEPNVDPEPEEPSTDDVPNFVQPTGAHNAYNTGDRVLFTDGHVYESTIDNNVWSPTDYPQGWQLIE